MENLADETSIRKPLPPAIGYLVALALVAASGVLAEVLRAKLGLRDPSLIFLTGVLASALLAGLRPSLVAAAASVLAYDYFFTEPFRTFSINDPQDVLSLVVFLAVAIVAGNLTAQLAKQVTAAREREARTAALYEFSRELVATDRLEDLLAVIVRCVATRFKADAIVLLPDGGLLKARAAHPAGAVVAASEREAVQFAWAEGRSATMAVLSAVGGSWVHISLGTIRGEVGVLSLNMHGPVRFLPEDQKLLDAFTQQAGVALERCLVDILRTRRPETDANNRSSFTTDARVRAILDRIDLLQREFMHLKLDAAELVKSSSGQAG